MEERTTDEIAAIYTAAGHSVNLINADESYLAYTTRTDIFDTEPEWKATIERNVKHLEIIKAYSIWTTESFGDIDAAITKGKTLYA